nr:hypothetical protein [Acidimicrobiia bacterium]
MQQQGATVSKRTTRRIGYGVAVAVNAAMLVIVNNVLEWEWFAWLTDDLNDVLPLINLSLAASLLANVAYFANDTPAFKGVAELVLNAISWLVVFRLLRVFPFDFSSYSATWETLTRGILVVAIIAISLA